MPAVMWLRPGITVTTLALAALLCLGVATWIASLPSFPSRKPRQRGDRKGSVPSLPFVQPQYGGPNAVGALDEPHFTGAGVEVGDGGVFYQVTSCPASVNCRTYSSLS